MIMFGFLNKDFNPRIGLLYNGHSVNLKYTIDQDEAYSRRDVAGKGKFIEHKVEVYNEEVSLKLPVSTGSNITRDFRDYLATKAKTGFLSDDCLGIWKKVLDEFDVVFDDGVFFQKKGDEDVKKKEDVNMGLFYMKLFLEGFFRFTPVKREDQKNKGNFIDTILSYDYSGDNEDFGQISYKHKDNIYETPLYGVYAPMFIDYLFGGIVDFGNGRVLQKRQIDAVMQLGKINMIAAPRGGGKSFIAILISGLCLIRERVGPQEKSRPILINYFGETEEGNQQVIDYIMNIPKKFGDFGLFKPRLGDNCLEFLDKGDVVGRVQFKSNQGKTKGRGGRPSVVIIDEASRIDEFVFKTAFSNAIRDDTQIICVSTIDPDTDKNWFYQRLIEAEQDMYSYESVEDAVVRIRKKYGFDKKRSREEFTDQELLNAKNELRESRPFVGLRYTFDDVEFITEDEKKKKLELAKNMDRNFILAEFYSRFADKSVLFDLKGNIEQDMPKYYERIAIGYDPASEFDNAALVVVGLNGDKIYVIDSQILDRDPQRQFAQLQEAIDNCGRLFDPELGKENRIIHVAVDFGYGGEFILSQLEMRGIPIDYPIKINAHGKDVSRGGRFITMGKAFIVNIYKNRFTNGNIKISSHLNQKKGLIEEIGYFQPKIGTKSTKFEAIVGKDDQVSAMMLAGFCFYEDIIIRSAIKEKQMEKKGRTLDDFIEHSNGGAMTNYNYHSLYGTFRY